MYIYIYIYICILLYTQYQSYRSLYVIKRRKKREKKVYVRSKARVKQYDEYNIILYNDTLIKEDGTKN